jgi:hypothetical protein
VSKILRCSTPDCFEKHWAPLEGNPLGSHVETPPPDGSCCAIPRPSRHGFSRRKAPPALLIKDRHQHLKAHRIADSSITRI